MTCKGFKKRKIVGTKSGLLAMIGGGLLLCVLTSSFPARQAWSATSESVELETMIAIQERARDDVDRKIKQYNEEANKKAQVAKGLVGQVTELRQNSQKAQSQIALLELQTKKLQMSISELNQEIARSEAALNNLSKQLRDRIVSIYKYSSREDMNLLLSAENTHEVVVFAYLLERIGRQEQKTIDDLSYQVKELNRSRNDLSQSRKQVHTRAEELSRERRKYDESLKKTNGLLSSVQRERQKAMGAVKELEQAQREIGNTIMTLMNKKKSKPSVPPPSSGAQRGGGAVVEEPAVYLARGSKLDWPIRGSIASPYGSRVHPTFKTKSFNSGIDIRAAANAPVKAAGPGEVLFEGWLRGFGQVVIIDHGGNLSTVYAHLASTRVKEGSRVKSGTVIGTVGNTGILEGYNLHFEVRQGNEAKDPLGYLRRS